ncbi:WHG domain-containing protein [Bacillus salitolerans]|uniref:WHG domain-containing protein n=1 Tax=Bacillus salitolerans TaxID=1437434 RepID=A0ABW4LIY7_9BACI
MSPRIGLDQTTILQTAAEIANTEGLAAVTLASLAKKLNIRPPSLYNHVDGLEGLRKKLAIYALEKLYNSLTPVVIGRSGDEAVFHLAQAYVRFARDSPGLYEATLQAPNTHDTEVQLIGKRIVELTIHVLRAYELEDEAAIHAVRGLRSILHGFASLEQKGGFGLPLDLDKSFTLLIKAYLSGIHEMKN